MLSKKRLVGPIPTSAPLKCCEFAKTDANSLVFAAQSPSHAVRVTAPFTQGGLERLRSRLSILAPVFHVAGPDHRQLRVRGFPGDGLLFLFLQSVHPGLACPGEGWIIRTQLQRSAGHGLCGPRQRDFPCQSGPGRPGTSFPERKGVPSSRQGPRRALPAPAGTAAWRHRC